jgi:hypothetical protein
MFGSKGQFFIIAVLIFVIYYASLIFYSFNTQSLIERQQSIENFLFQNYFEQIKEEEKNIFEYFYFNESMRDFIKNFTIYARNKFALSNFNLGALFLLANYSEISSGQNQSLSVYLLNLLNEKINANLTFNQTSSFASLNDLESFETSFNFSISEDKEENLYLSCEEGNFTIAIPLKIGKSKKIGFWILVFEREKLKLKESFSLVG